MKLYRATGSVPLLAYFLAEDDTDAFTKAGVALWTEEWEGTKDGVVTVTTVRQPVSLREVVAEKWGDKRPHLIPDAVTLCTCSEFLKMQQVAHERMLASQQQVFYFYYKGWADA